MTELDLGRFRQISLESLTYSDQLQRRFDSKYVLPEHRLGLIVDDLDESWSVLTVDGHNVQRYLTRYFDTEAFQSFSDHLMRRRLRYKVRVRTYGVGGPVFLELKLKTGRTQTDKYRWPYGSSFPVSLHGSDMELINKTLDLAYGKSLSEQLLPTIDMQFERITFFNESSNERITVDQNIAIVKDNQAHDLMPSGAVLEVKSNTFYGSTVRRLQSRGLRPTSFSKYCYAISCQYPELRQQPRINAYRDLKIAKI